MEQSTTPINQDAASAYNNLASLLRILGKYEDAEALLQHSQAIIEELLPAEHPRVAIGWSSLGLLRKAQGRLATRSVLFAGTFRSREITRTGGRRNGDDAEQPWRDLHRAAPSVRRRRDASAGTCGSAAAFRRSARTGLTTLSNIGHLRLLQRRHAEAEDLYRRSLAICEGTLGTGHPEVAAVLNNLAQVYRATRKDRKAQPLLLRALAIWERAFGPDHPNVAAALANLGSLHTERRKYQEAAPLFKRALAIDEKALGPSHPALNRDLNNLAAMYHRQRRYSEAEPLYLRALAIGDPPGTLNSLRNLAELYREQGKFAQADPLYRRLLKSLEGGPGEVSLEFAKSLDRYAEILRGMEQHAEAARVETQALGIRVRHSLRK